VKKKPSPGQKSIWEEWDAPMDEIRRVAKKFVLANCYDPKVVEMRFEGVEDLIENSKPVDKRVSNDTQTLNPCVERD
jgi:hypothetical protein